MKSISVPIGEARTALCALVRRVQSGTRVTLTSHGRPAAVIVPVETAAAPWRAPVPDDSKRYGDLDSPVMEPWA